MQRHSKISQTKVNPKAVVTALICVVFLLIGSMVSAYALEPMPTAPSNPYGAIVNGKHISQTDIIFVRAVFNVQYESGGFDHLYPVALYRHTDGTIRAVFWTNALDTAGSGNRPFYSYDGAGQFNVVNATSSIRYQMTEYGFNNLYTGSFPSTIASQDMFSYRNADGEWIDNPDAFGGASNNNTQVTLAFNRWQSYAAQGDTPSNPSNPSNPSVSYEIDIGSIITALPQSARNLIDTAFGFELFGINVASTLSCILLLAIVVFVVKWLMAR